MVITGKNLLSSIGMLLILITSSCDELFQNVEDGLSDDEIVAGLKEALAHGTDTAVANLSIPDGYFGDQVVKILLPAEAQPIYDQLSNVPILDQFVAETIYTINRAAEDAANEAAPIFIDAIAEMTIVDGLNILYGSDTAATHYLRAQTYADLYDAFEPEISTSLNKEIVLGISAEDSYSGLINTYNTASLGGLLFDKIETNTLSDHVTTRALHGLFVKVGDEERLIREDPLHRVTEILEKVFSELDS